MALALTIRKARLTDVEAVVELWKELLDFHKAIDPFWSRSRTGHKTFAEYLTKECIGADRRRAWLAQAGQRTVGFAMGAIEDYPPCLRIKQYGLLECLVVTKSWRNKGVGEKLVKRARRWFADKGMTRIEVRHAAANTLAGGFYAGLGFEPYLTTVFTQIE
jgi:GNAT superfamily N-acetyltransferase